MSAQYGVMNDSPFLLLLSQVLLSWNTHFKTRNISKRNILSSEWGRGPISHRFVITYMLISKIIVDSKGAEMSTVR